MLRTEGKVAGGSRCVREKRQGKEAMNPRSPSYGGKRRSHNAQQRMKIGRRITRRRQNGKGKDLKCHPEKKNEDDYTSVFEGEKEQGREKNGGKKKIQGPPKRGGDRSNCQARDGRRSL